MNEIFHRDDSEFAQGSFDNLVVVQWDALLVDLSVTSLVDEFADGLEVGLAVGNVGLNELEHLGSRFRHFDENTVVDLEETEELEDLSGLGGNLVDTSQSDYKVNLWLSGNVELSRALCYSPQADLLSLLLAVLVDILLSALEDDLTSLLVGDLSLLCSLETLLSCSGGVLSSLEYGLFESKGGRRSKRFV